MVNSNTKHRVRAYLNSNIIPLTPEAIEKIRDAHTRKIPNRKRDMCRDYRIAPPISQPEILPQYSSSGTINPEQVIPSSKLVSKKSSRKKIDKSSPIAKLPKGGDLSESKTIYHSTSSISNSDEQTRMKKLREYKKQLQNES
ncbi:1568_t:CDS:2 [Ambispora gerdemannii]|uniref:1568_t:CDS:1 n=1 Tax=Ambispora gerdemannii TaxID=144530 RepID=A0A9N9CHL5_9GLOM|nr:1568_t:CDS:2 [Ambispora gerdemannii]